MPKFATNADDPVEQFLATVAMALSSAMDPDAPPIRYWTCAATISLARRDFHEALARQGQRVH